MLGTLDHGCTNITSSPTKDVSPSSIPTPSSAPPISQRWTGSMTAVVASAGVLLVSVAAFVYFKYRRRRQMGAQPVPTEERGVWEDWKGYNDPSDAHPAEGLDARSAGHMSVRSDEGEGESKKLLGTGDHPENTAAAPRSAPRTLPKQRSDSFGASHLFRHFSAASGGSQACQFPATSVRSPGGDDAGYAPTMSMAMRPFSFSHRALLVAIPEQDEARRSLVSRGLVDTVEPDEVPHVLRSALEEHAALAAAASATASVSAVSRSPEQDDSERAASLGRGGDGDGDRTPTVTLDDGGSVARPSAARILERSSTAGTTSSDTSLEIMRLSRLVLGSSAARPDVDVDADHHHRVSDARMSNSPQDATRAIADRTSKDAAGASPGGGGGAGDEAGPSSAGTGGSNRKGSLASSRVDSVAAPSSPDLDPSFPPGMHEPDTRARPAVDLLVPVPPDEKTEGNGTGNGKGKEKEKERPRALVLVGEPDRRYSEPTQVHSPESLPLGDTTRRDSYPARRVVSHRDPAARRRVAVDAGVSVLGGPELGEVIVPAIGPRSTLSPPGMNVSRGSSGSTLPPPYETLPL
ncbi:hypothetical protein C8Q76DRAFT_256700 [Earliella scabrosa]|nr:hypothetical protein C8Q76DRAFT_256700 [Earliella scabrosa]